MLSIDVLSVGAPSRRPVRYIIGDNSAHAAEELTGQMMLHDDPSSPGHQKARVHLPPGRDIPVAYTLAVSGLSVSEREQLSQPSTLRDALGSSADEVNREQWRTWVDNEVREGRLPPLTSEIVSSL